MSSSWTLGQVFATRAREHPERALLVARHKTASYTVQRPLQFGLALAGVASLLTGVTAIALLVALGIATWTGLVAPVAVVQPHRGVVD